MTVDQGSSPGGSSQDAQSAAVAALQAGSGEGQVDQGSVKQVQSPAPAPAQTKATENGSGLANPFLEKVAPEDRAIVEKYIKDWDGSVTKKFQELHGQLEPYQNLGADHETLGQAMQLLEMINSDPEQVMSLLQEAMGQGEEETPQGLEGQNTGGAENPMAGLPPQFVEQFNQMQQVLEALAGNHLEQQTQQQQKEEDTQLDTTLSSLKEKHGEFDEDYVMAKMMVGVDPEKAVESYFAAIQGQVNKRAATPNVPAILGGGGAAPQGASDIKDASSKDVRALVTNLLKNQAQA